jgi:predicted ribosome quality control (RQC) complex YloA/Tae2 family protein
MIQKLLLDKDQVILALPDIDNWDEYGEDGLPPIRNVTVSIKESAHCNARIMFASYRASKEKEVKTIDASTTALKAAEAKARQQLAEAKKKKERVQVLPVRKTYWFEKFAWFITSDNYLVVAGKDAQQNEQLVKRYLRPGDAYLHAEVHGAATCILRAKRRRRKDGKTQVIPLSDQALREAGCFTICRSSAWKSKMVTSAYWVESHQVSKTAPTGEYLTVGSFMVRGRKNFLPASSLEMGLGERH